MRRMVHIDDMGVSYAEVSDGVSVVGPRVEELEADHLDDKAWDQLKRKIKTGKLDHATVRKIIGADVK